MAKPPTRQITSDDCVVTVEGEDYTPHEGEWIRVLPGITAAEIRLLRELQELKPKLEAIEGDDEAQGQSIVLLDKSYDRAVSMVARRVVEWNWTDSEGKKYPSGPTTEVIQELDVQELFYLVAAVRGETAGERKNGSRPSPTTSSASRQRRSRA